MTIYDLLLLLLLSSLLSIMMKNQSTKYQARSQVALGFFFLIFLVSSQGKPNKLKVDSILSKKFEVEHLSQEMLLRNSSYDQRSSSQRVVNQLYFDNDNKLGFEQKWIGWNIGDICPNGIAERSYRYSNEDVSYKKTAIVSDNPRFDIEYCQKNKETEVIDRFLVALSEKEDVLWKRSILEKHKYSYSMEKIIGVSPKWVIMNKSQKNRICILSALDGSIEISYQNLHYIDSNNVVIATYDGQNRILYSANKNKRNEGKSIELTMHNLVSKEEKILLKFPVELARFPFHSAVPMEVIKLEYLPKYNLIAILLMTGYEGNNNSKFILFDINSEKKIFATEYPQYIRPLMISNKEGTSVGISYQKNDKIRIIDQYNISLNN